MAAKMDFGLQAGGGSPYFPDMEMDSATWGRTRPSMAKVRVEIKLLKTQSKSVRIGFENDNSPLRGYYQKLEYKGIPKYCKHLLMLRGMRLTMPKISNREDVHDESKEKDTSAKREESNKAKNSSGENAREESKEKDTSAKREEANKAKNSSGEDACEGIKEKDTSSNHNECSSNAKDESQIHHVEKEENQHSGHITATTNEKTQSRPNYQAEKNKKSKKRTMPTKKPSMLLKIIKSTKKKKKRRSKKLKEPSQIKEHIVETSESPES
ncbi:hypothetical protein KY285_033408 [Solanum tuberosum]|nr:hypothetical protein KY285_033408 [Solanum tuberosum]